MRPIESRIVQEVIRRNQQALDDLYDNLPRGRPGPVLSVIDGGRPDDAPVARRQSRPLLYLVQGERVTPAS